MLLGFLKRFGPITMAVALSLTGCAGADTHGPERPKTAAEAMDQRIHGVWRLTNYIPVQDLPPELLLAMQSDKSMMRLENGKVRSVSSSLQFQQSYRIDRVNGDTFHLFITDDKGVEHESVCQLDNLGSMSFEALREPWKGRGVLTREGTALKPVK